MKKLVYVILIIITYVSNSWGWENERTHPRITEFAASKFFDPVFLDESYTLGNEGQTATEWLRRGSILEDAGTGGQFLGGTARSLNHFHSPTTTNPTKSTLETSGLSDLPFFISNGISALAWAQNGPYQISKGWNDWSWKKVREHQYNYLTALSKTDEDANLARLLMGLGYQMHLVQDMGHPSHVRNNTHMIDGKGWGGFETWAAKNDTKVIRDAILNKKDINGNPEFPIPVVSVDLTVPFDTSHNLSPVARLFDTRTYLGTSMPTAQLNQGLSEYTNSNFFSQDTIFAAERFSGNHEHKYYFPYPRKDSTNVQEYLDRTLSPTTETDETGKHKTSIWIRKTGDGERIDHLAIEGNFTRFWQRVLGEGNRFYGSFELDEIIYRDYAQKLIPRSVGYSKAMLDYFFRGELTVTVPTDTPPTNNRIRLNVRNSTATAEAMDAGSIDLMVTFRQYKKDSTAAAGNLIPDGDYQFRKYTLGGCSDTNLRCKSIGTTDTLLDFDLSANPLPPLARDISLIVVYRGKLGNEPDSVAYDQIYLDSIAGGLDLSLPSRGVYASVSGDSISNTFSDFALSAKNTTTSASGAGTTELLVIYREASSNPFLSQPVDSSANIKYASVTVDNQQGIPTTGTADLLYSLSSAPIPVTATDVYAYLIHTAQDGTITYGYRDISEPTPVDVFNNADKICISRQWYTAGTSEAIALSAPDLFDPYAHNIDTIFAKDSSTASLASSSNFTFSSPSALAGGNFRRLGYILTDYSFNYSLLENWVNVSADDPWTITEGADQHPGTAVKNQTDADGNYIWPAMYTMRGNNMWWGASVIWDNDTYPANSYCDWNALP